MGSGLPFGNTFVDPIADAAIGLLKNSLNQFMAIDLRQLLPDIILCLDFIDMAMICVEKSKKIDIGLIHVDTSNTACNTYILTMVANGADSLKFLRMQA